MTDIFEYKLESLAANELLPCLTEAEQREMQRFVQQADQMRFLYARAHLRKLLAERFSLEPTAVMLQTGEHGKLSSSNCPIHFNIAHSGDWVVIALDVEKFVGVDVEFMRRKVNIMDLAARFFHAQEFCALKALPQDLQQKSFFYTWVCKEAVIKCDGRGLSLGLENFAVNVDPRLAAELIVPPPDTALSSWHLNVWQCDPEYYCASAIADSGA